MAAKRTTERQPDETSADQTKSAPQPLPAPGKGPLAGYPTPAGATHWRVHPIGTDGRIKDALALANDSDGQPVTRYPVASLGDAAWWDALPTGAQVRVVFTRYHGDQLKARLGQGPIWTVPTGGERVAPAPPPAPAAAAPAGGDSGGHALFLVLRQLQSEAQSSADLRAARELAALRELYQTQAQMTRDYFAQMTSLFLTERKDERQAEHKKRADEARREERLTAAVAQATRSAIAESKEAEEEEEEEEEEPEIDAVEKALTGLTDTIKPLAAEIGKRVAKNAIG